MTRERGRGNPWVLLATCGGVGGLPVAPGTWGSLVGVLLGVIGAKLLRHPYALFTLIAAFVLFAWICGKAARALGEPDPRSVILDEVWGMAAVVMALPWLVSVWSHLIVGFMLFRAFDVAEPPPLRELERLSGGWGIMADDLGAAAYTILLLWVIHIVG